MPVEKGPKGMKACMDEWKAGNLHSGKGGPIVPQGRQDKAVAICLNASGQGRRQRPRGRRQ